MSLPHAKGLRRSWSYAKAALHQGNACKAPRRRCTASSLSRRREPASPSGGFSATENVSIDTSGGGNRTEDRTLFRCGRGWRSRFWNACLVWRQSRYSRPSRQQAPAPPVGVRPGLGDPTAVSGLTDTRTGSQIASFAVLPTLSARAQRTPYSSATWPSHNLSLIHI